MKRVLVGFFTFVLAFSILGCKAVSKSDPIVYLNGFYQNLIDAKYDDAFDMFCAATKSNWTKQDYLTYMKTITYVLKSVKLTKLSEFKDKDLDGVSYKSVVEINVTQATHDTFTKEDSSQSFSRFVVSENGEWRIYRGKENAKALLAAAKEDLAYCYINATGVGRDYNQAATLLNEGIAVCPTLADQYYALGYTYEMLNRIDDAIGVLNTYITMSADTEGISNAYNLLGNCYRAKNDKTNAKASYQKAIESNPNNQYAISNLNSLK
jgi:tetratricopeptide (TPR) repeat protein